MITSGVDWVRCAILCSSRRKLEDVLGIRSCCILTCPHFPGSLRCHSLPTRSVRGHAVILSLSCLHSDFTLQIWHCVIYPWIRDLDSYSFKSCVVLARAARREVAIIPLFSANPVPFKLLAACSTTERRMKRTFTSTPS